MSNSDYTILLVDDEPDILEFVSYNLKKEGYKVLAASNGEDAVSISKKEKPELILLDVMMPGMDGIETCDQLRKIPELEDTLIAFLTARGEDYSQVAGFDAGADDYITKPIKPKVLISRIKALLRRYGQTQKANSSLQEFGHLTIDLDKYQVRYKDKKLDLPARNLNFSLYSLPAPVRFSIAMRSSTKFGATM